MRAHRLPLAQHLGGSARRHLGDAGAVRQGMTHRCPPLAVGRESRPVLCDRRVVIDQPPLGQDVHAGADDWLGGGENREERVVRHRASGGGVSGAGPGVDCEFSVQVGRDLEAGLRTLSGLPDGLLE